MIKYVLVQLHLYVRVMLFVLVKDIFGDIIVVIVP